MIPRKILVLGLLLSAAMTAVRAQDAFFSSRTEAVRVDVLATDNNGQPILGLGPSDFELLDAGVPQQIDIVSFDEIPLNVILVLDTSVSMWGEPLVDLQNAGRTLLDGLMSTDSAALITFSHVVALGTGLTTEFDRVRSALDRAEASGDTALFDAGYTAMMLAQSDVGRSLVIVFSDGLDTSSWLSDASVLETARRSDAVVYAVSVGENTRRTFLDDLGDATGGTLFKIGSTRDLGAAFLRVIQEFRRRYLLSYSPSGVTKSGWHRLDVRVKGRKAIVRARPGYLAGATAP
jgi:VWFA-related protein